jgi:uncharacterized protein YcfL
MRLIAPALLLIAAYLLTGCASTRFYHNGQLVLETQANITGLVVTKDGELRAAKVDHSTATRAGGSVVGTATAGALPIVTALARP